LNKLTRAELQGVVGHEMGHIANWDTRYMTAVGILFGLITLVSDGIKRVVYFTRYGGGRSSSSGSGNGGGGVVVLILIAIVFLFSILAPIAATFVRFAVSRQREYLADATSVQFTRNPQAMISTLEKLAAQAEPFDGANRATQHMFIINPFRNFDKSSGALMSTHPPVESRIDRLRDLGGN
jgi:heat shock protein HtpX